METPGWPTSWTPPRGNKRRGPIAKPPAAKSSGRLCLKKSGVCRFFEVSMAPLRLRRGRGAMQGNPLRSKAVCNLPYPPGAFSCPFGIIRLAPPNPIRADRGGSPVRKGVGGSRLGGAQRPLRTALQPPNRRIFSTGRLFAPLLLHLLLQAHQVYPGQAVETGGDDARLPEAQLGVKPAGYLVAGVGVDA